MRLEGGWSLGWRMAGGGRGGRDIVKSPTLVPSACTDLQIDQSHSDDPCNKPPFSTPHMDGPAIFSWCHGFLAV